MDPYENNFSTWNNLALAYQEQFMDLSLYDDTYNSFCELVKKKDASIFEIACGPGNITRYLLSKRPDFNLQAIDIAPNMVQLARQNNPAAQITVMDCRDLSSVSTLFDGIVIGFCIPYLSGNDCRKLIAECARLMPGSGILYLSTPEADADGSGFQASSDGQNKMYVARHSEKFLTDLFAQNDFDLLEVMRKNYKKKDGTVEIHQVFLARKRML